MNDKIAIRRLANLLENEFLMYDNQDPAFDYLKDNEIVISKTNASDVFVLEIKEYYD